MHCQDIFAKCHFPAFPPIELDNVIFRQVGQILKEPRFIAAGHKKSRGPVIDPLFLPQLLQAC